MSVHAVAIHEPDAPFETMLIQHLRPAIPAVLRGAAAHWPCRVRWTPDFLLQRYGEAVIEWQDCRDGRRGNGRLADYFALPDAIRRHIYVVDWDFRPRYPELAEDIGGLPQLALDWVPLIPAAARPELLWIYLGDAGTGGGTHLDNYGSSAWLAVLSGRKRVRFADPGGLSAAAMSRLDLFDDEAIAGLEVLEARLEAGDVLFVPAGRWHAARNEAACLSVTGNFVDGANFSLHRRFYQKQWHGRRMLVTELNRLHDMAAGPARELLGAHLEAALSDLRADLEAELRECAQFEAVLASGREGGHAAA